MATADTPVDPLARAVLDAFASDPGALARLRDLVDEYADDGQVNDTTQNAPAYTVDSLAAALDVSSRVVRNAITRGELEAVKRGARWIISADAVDAWSHPAAGERRTRNAKPRAHRKRPRRPLGDALRSVAS